MDWINNPRTFEEYEPLLQYVEHIGPNTKISLDSTYQDRPEFAPYIEQDGDEEYEVTFDPEDIKDKFQELDIKQSDWDEIVAGTEVGKKVFDEKYKACAVNVWYDSELYWSPDGLVSVTGIRDWKNFGDKTWVEILNVQPVDMETGYADFWLDSRMIFHAGAMIIDDFEYERLYEDD